MLHQIRAYVPDYEKGDWNTTSQIATRYKTAIKNGAKTLIPLATEGIPTLADTDVRNLWLVRCGHTFTTVQEALEFLEDKASHCLLE